MDVALRTSKLSNARRLKVGCVAIRDRRIICCGYNGTGPGEDNNCEYELPDGSLITKPNVFHAEVNMINFAREYGISLLDCALYISHEPCEPCSKKVIESGIVEVFANVRYTGSNPNGREILGSRLKFMENLYNG
jgi:dCMP deaminase